MNQYKPSVDVRELANLLAPPDEVDDDDIEAATMQCMKSPGVTPATIVGSKPRCINSSKEPNLSTYRKKEADILGDIWAVAEVQCGQWEEPADPRTRPEYEITYRQRLSASQVYLPISNVGTIGQGEEDLVVRVVIPGDLLTEVTLEVNSSTLDLASPNYLLHLPLPRSVDQRKGVATWDPSEHTLLVTLPVLDTPLLTPVSSKN